MSIDDCRTRKAQRRTILSKIEQLRKGVQEAIPEHGETNSIEGLIGELYSHQCRTNAALESIQRELRALRAAPAAVCALGEHARRMNGDANEPLATVDLILKPGDCGRATAIGALREICAVARFVEVWDPYLFARSKAGTRKETPDEFASRLASDLMGVLPETTTRLVVTGCESHTFAHGVERLRSRLMEARANLEFDVRYSDDFHDRIWVINGCKSFAVGTSLNSIGLKKPSYILRLDEADHLALYAWLKPETQQESAAAA